MIFGTHIAARVVLYLLKYGGVVLIPLIKSYAESRARCHFWRAIPFSWFALLPAAQSGSNSSVAKKTMRHFCGPVSRVK